MARLTAEEKRRILEEQEAEDKRAREAFRLTMPSRLQKLSDLAQSLGVSAQVKLISTGVQLTVYHDSQPYIDSELTYDSEEWEVEHVESELQRLKDARDAREARLALAKATWVKLGTAEQSAVKEFIHSLY